MCLNEYNDKIENGIDDILSNMPTKLTAKICQLNYKLKNKYINKDRIELTKTFWKNHKINKPIIDW